MHAVRNRKLTNKRVSYCNHLFSHYFDAGIKPGFSYINICKVALREMLKTEGNARDIILKCIKKECLMANIALIQ